MVSWRLLPFPTEKIHIRSRPLAESRSELASHCPPGCQVILLASVAVSTLASLRSGPPIAGINIRLPPVPNRSPRALGLA